MSRPNRIRAVPYYWLHEDLTRTDGIALMAPHYDGKMTRVLAHLTEAEAVRLCNQIIDVIETQRESEEK